MDDGEQLCVGLDATFQPSSTYLAVDNNQPAVARLVHAHAHLYIEASSEDDLIARVAAFDKAWNEVHPQQPGADEVHCTAHVDYEPSSRVTSARPKRMMRTRNARTTEEP